ncbi:hypothetical protein [Streptomyces echinatus]
MKIRTSTTWDESAQIIGVTSVPGGCSCTKPWEYRPNMATRTW